jgi:DNA-binding SARP family transcriptional activator
MGGANNDHAQGGAASVHIRLMNGFTTEVGGDQVTLPLDAQRLVAYVALERRPMSRVHVAGRLWSDGSQERAFGNLRSALWRVRKEVDVLAADTNSVSLRSGVSTDVQLIERLASHADRSDAWTSNLDGDHRLFCGELLPDWYDEWTLVERERIRQICLHALESVALRLLEAGKYTEALEASLAAVALEPLRESGHRVVIRIHQAEGNFWEAKRHYDNFTTLLETELGLRPSPILEGLMAEPLVKT